MSVETGQSEDYKRTVKAAVLDECSFLRLTLSNKLREDDTPWIRITVRPVMIRARRRMQFSYFDAKKDITKNYSGEETEVRLDEALSIPFGRIHVQTTSGDISVRITRKGKPLVNRSRPSRSEQEPVLAHDRVKEYPLPAGKPDALLQALGVMGTDGSIKVGMQGKLHQINEFLRIIDLTVPPIAVPGQPIRIVDGGCGSAYLTFAAYHYLRDLRGIPVQVTGIDTNAQLAGKCSGLRESLGWQGPEFSVSSIADFEPEDLPDVVLSLHACDTATDEVIAQGILWGSKVILAAPCCQHELHEQLHAALFRPVLRHGVLKERLADILTDAFRSLVLRILGYRASVIEFVSPEHTSKNLMIRAQKALKPGNAQAVREYKDLKAYWEVSPFIEEMLGDTLRQYL